MLSSICSCLKEEFRKLSLSWIMMFQYKRKEHKICLCLENHVSNCRCRTGLFPLMVSFLFWSMNKGRSFRENTQANPLSEFSVCVCVRVCVCVCVCEREEGVSVRERRVSSHSWGSSYVYLARDRGVCSFISPSQLSPSVIRGHSLLHWPCVITVMCVCWCVYVCVWMLVSYPISSKVENDFLLLSRWSNFCFLKCFAKAITKIMRSFKCLIWI